MSDKTLKVVRKWFTDLSTIGEMSIDGVFECFTLEPTFRGHAAKVMGKTAIPEGRYEIGLYNSFHNKGIVPLLLNVPNFEWVEIHVGNAPKDTAACLLVGQKRNTDQPDLILESRVAFTSLLAKVQEALKVGKVFCEVANCDERTPKE